MNWPWVYMCPLHPEPSSHIPPHPISPGCHRAPVLGAMCHTLLRLSILHMVMYMFQCHSLKSSLSFKVTLFILSFTHLLIFSAKKYLWSTYYRLVSQIFVILWLLAYKNS